MKPTSELRRDIVSGEWVAIATGRARRPHDFIRKSHPAFDQLGRACPFDSPNEEILAAYSLEGGGKKNGFGVRVVHNKYPMFDKGVCAVFHSIGPYEWTEGVGFHEIVITSDHDRPLPLLSDKEAELVIRAYQDRYRALAEDACVEYVAIFHNHGPQAGGTIVHPHSQIIAIPVVPPDVRRSLTGSAHYFKKYKTCVHCAILRYELKVKKRVVYENKLFVVVAPFASKSAFEMRIFPRRHIAHFATLTPEERKALAQALRISLRKLYRGLNNIDYNFFLHTAPVGKAEDFSHYHWHFEIIPKAAIWAGFEIGTGIEVSVIAPEEAAAFLRKK